MAEDEPGVRSSLRAGLKNSGYEAAEAKQLILQTSSGPPDVLITVLVMQE